MNDKQKQMAAKKDVNITDTMDETANDELRKAKEEFDYVRFTIVDFHGITRSKTVPKAKFEQFFHEGCSFFAGVIGLSLAGPMVCRDIQSIKRTNSGNVFAKPQPNTLHLLPLNGSGKTRIGEVICETYFPMENVIQECNPRTLARTQLSRLEQMGYQLKSSWELEVSFYDKETLEPNFTKSTSAFTNSMYDEQEEILLEAEQAFRHMEIQIETIQTEASPGQYEFATSPQIGIKPCDYLIMMKDVLRQIARKHGKIAVFMSKPFAAPGYSAALHFNHSLVHITSASHHVFSDVNKPHFLSDTCRSWLGGLIKHSPGLTALQSPTVNCYRRLHKYIAPSRADWGLDDRMACYRVKNYTPSSTYIECRMPSGSANPYLVMASTVAAGIDGLVNQYGCPQSIGNQDSVSEELPHTLQEALVALEKDDYLVKTFGEEFITWISWLKRNEIHEFEGFDPDSEDTIEKERQCYMKLL